MSTIHENKSLFWKRKDDSESSLERESNNKKIIAGMGAILLASTLFIGLWYHQFTYFDVKLEYIISKIETISTVKTACYAANK